MDQLLDVLFESAHKVRLLRLFINNPESSFTLDEIKRLTQLPQARITRELTKLAKIEFIRIKTQQARTDAKKNKRKKSVKSRKKITGIQLNLEFPLLGEIRDLILKSSGAPRKKMLAQIKRLGKIKLVALSGIFINSDQERIDLLIVGDDISQRLLEKFLVQVESEIGKNLRYAVMDTDEFRYRMNMYDRFLRDVLERPHEKLFNKLHNIGI